MSHSERVCVRAVLLSVVFLFMIAAIYGCDDDDFFSQDARIEVCNYDNKEYFVRLHWSEDDSIVDEIELEDAIPLVLDFCEEFEDVEEGSYYLTIHEQFDGEPIDTSVVFHIEEDETEQFYIDDDGDIHRI